VYLAVEGPRDNSGQRHVLADRIDISKWDLGVHRIEWDAPETTSGMDIAVTPARRDPVRVPPGAFRTLKRP
jgi:hypothetical protein